ncbi:alginate lyase family protein [Palleronia sp.]|uniref:alginate lyase family protein n=1 Tax=Palleronia sp. TaxID=1940284 RepID=UPI0035C85328
MPQPSDLFRRAKTRFRGAGRVERAAWMTGVAVTSPLVVPVFLGFWMRRRAVKRRGLGASPRLASPRFVMSSTPPPAVAPDPSVEAQLAALPNLFALVRVIGNDLPPRHKIGQSRENLDFVLRNESPFDACEKLWIVNRIVDKAEEARIIARLEEAGATYEVIPFDADEYADVPLDFSHFQEPQVLQSDAFAALDEPTQIRVVAQIYRLKNVYVMHNNGARNRALVLGQARAKWVLPFDGNCFLTEADWDRIRADVTAAPERQYFVVPMARLGSNDRAFDDMPPEDAQEEPQILFRRDAPARFDEAHPYGRRPKVELLARLGVPGLWNQWRMDPWDIPAGPVGPDAHRVGRAGMVRRLASGRADLEAQSRNVLHQRGLARSGAIVATLRRADAAVLAARGHSPDRPVLFDRDRLPWHAGRPLGRAVAAVASEARSRGTYSVTQKTELPPSGDPHDYYHPAPHWWPNPNTSTGLPYVKRDGDRLPGTEMYGEGSEKFDRTRWQMMADDTTVCALDWAIDKDAAARDHARHLVRTWFLDDETAMTPHMRFAQVRRGHNGDEGSATGIIELKDLAFVLDAVRLLDDPALSEDLRGWLRPYADWLATSPQGVAERRARNNHGTFFDLQFAAVAAFLGDIDALLDSWMHSVSRIGGQFDEQGAQPHELTRTLTQHYCAFNLQGWLTLLTLYRGCGIPVDAQPEIARIGTGVGWLLNQRGAEWPYEQIEPFDTDRFAPIALAAADLGIAPAPDQDDLALAEARPRFHPHDGIPPFWPLMLGTVRAERTAE